MEKGKQKEESEFDVVREGRKWEQNPGGGEEGKGYVICFCSCGFVVQGGKYTYLEKGQRSIQK